MMQHELVLPCLKASDWEGSETSVCYRLRLEVETPYLPWVAFGYDQPHTFALLSRAALAELNKSEQEVEREALLNLGQRSASWESVDVKLGFLKKLRMLACTDDFFAAERILDVGFMQQGQSRLKTKALAVGVPRRGVLMVTDAQQPVERLSLFVGAVSAQYHRAESAPITPGVFALVDGRIVGMLQGGEDIGKEMVERAGGGERPFLQRLVVADSASGLEAVHLVVGGQELNGLASAIQSAFADTLQHDLSRPEFGGEIALVVIAEDTPETVRNALPSLVAHLQSVIDEANLKTIAGRPLRVSLRVKEAGFGPPS
jgi:hypothetical protein